MVAANILESVRSTCQKVFQARQEHIHVDQAALEEFVRQLDASEVVSCPQGLHLPVKFDNIEAEISFLAMYHLLDFGSGYNVELIKRYKRDAKEMLQYAILGMHMTAKRLDATWMAAFNHGSVTSNFGIETHEDAPVPNLPGVTMSRPGVLAPLVGSYAQVVREAGEALQEEGASSLGQAVLVTVDNLHKKNHNTPAAALVHELMDVLPGFSDKALYEGTHVVYARKAQALVYSLYRRFHNQDPRFDFKDIALLTADSGPVVPAVLRAKGILKYGNELAAIVDQEKDLQTGTHERGIRAAAVCAVDALVAAMDNKVNASQLSSYLEFLAESGQPLHDQIRKHLTKATLAY